MNNHMKVCKNIPDNAYVGDDQTMTSYCQSVSEEIGETSSSVKFDQEAARRALVHMIIIDELPLKFVRNEGFRQFVSIACPHFIVPLRTAITRDCHKFYFDTKNKSKTYFETCGQRISLTIDTWTSNQRQSYLCLTAHYIDDEWKLHKVVLNFIPCPRHKGDDVGLLIEKCLLDWGIDKVFAITADSSNDTTIAYLRRRLVNGETAILGENFSHMQCVAHIVNLVAKDKFKELNKSVERIRTVVRYVRQSPVRLKKFKNYAIEEEVDSKKSLFLDVPRRWNSVYRMLETAMIFKGVFERYEVSDVDFCADFLDGGPYANIGLPTKCDWNVVEQFVKVLHYFYKFTLRVSDSLSVTCNTFLLEISNVDKHLKEWLRSDDDALVDMARQMQAMFDDYRGNFEKMNMMLCVAVTLDPCLKFKFVLFIFKKMYGTDRVETMSNMAKSALYDVFEEYKKSYSSTVDKGSTITRESDNMDGETKVLGPRKKIFQQMISDIGGIEKSELDMYLDEWLETCSPDFDVLKWWKVHSPRFPILSRLARDVLAMPISTVASETVFSRGGRVIDDFKATLTPKMTRALKRCIYSKFCY